jgi:hypothetical protein
VADDLRRVSDPLYNGATPTTNPASSDLNPAIIPSRSLTKLTVPPGVGPKHPAQECKTSASLSDDPN